jgi:hypothetical protein
VPQARISTVWICAKTFSASLPKKPAESRLPLAALSSVALIAAGCSRISFCM